jgi:type VI protein secretion system component Hcp
MSPRVTRIGLGRAALLGLLAHAPAALAVDGHFLCAPGFWPNDTTYIVYRTQGCVDVESAAFGAAHTPAEGPPGALEAAAGPLVVRLPVGVIGASLLAAALDGTVIPTLHLHSIRSGSPSPTPEAYATLTLTDAVITEARYEFAGEVPWVVVSFVAPTVSWSVRPFQRDGSLGDPVSSSWTWPGP